MVERSHKKKRATSTTSILILENLYSVNWMKQLTLILLLCDWLFLVIEILVGEIPRGEIIGSQGGPRDETDI